MKKILVECGSICGALVIVMVAMGALSVGCASIDTTPKPTASVDAGGDTDSDIDTDSDGGSDTDADADTDTDADTDADSDTDSDTDTDTDIDAGTDGGADSGADAASDIDTDTDADTDTDTSCSCGTSHWVEDSQAELSDNDPSLSATVVTAAGSVTPEAYRTGALLMTGYPGQIISDPATATWADLAAAGETGRKISGNLDQDWGDGHPSGLGVTTDDYFTVGFEGELYLEYAETYTFHIYVDDSAIVDVHDGAAWQRVASAAIGETSHQFSVTTPGWHSIRIGVSENTSPTYFRMRYESPSVSLSVVPSSALRLPLNGVQGLEMLGYNRMYAERFIGHTLDTAGVNHNWTDSYPSETGISNGDTFTVRWVGQLLTAVSGDYDFRLNTDDGHRLWLNGTLLLDNWVDTSSDATSSPVTLEAGWHDVVVDHTENAGNAAAWLSYGASSPELADTVVPPDRLRPTVRSNSSSTGGRDYTSRDIPDLGTVDGYAFVSAPAGHTITSVDVLVQFSHSSVSDCVFTLYHPNGSTPHVLQNHGTGSPIYTNGITTFNGLDAAGFWNLHVEDDVGLDSGTVNNWTVVVHHQPSGGSPWDANPEYVSEIFDAGDTAEFGALNYSATLPVNAAVSISTRSAADTSALQTAAWSSPVASGDDIASPAGRYLQYRAQFTPGDTQQGSLDSIDISYCSCE